VGGWGGGGGGGLVHQLSSRFLGKCTTMTHRPSAAPRRRVEGITGYVKSFETTLTQQKPTVERKKFGL